MRKINFIPLLLIIILIVTVCFLFIALAEDVTIATYYPSPYGVYNQLMLYPSNLTASECNSANEGALYYDNAESVVKVCDGASWQPIGLGGGGAVKNVATIIVAANNSLDKNKADLAYRCDGIVDQIEINNAINAVAASAAGGGAVYLLEGTYNITGSIIMKSNVSLIGTGRGTVLSDNSGFNAISGSNIIRVLITQLRINGDSSIIGIPKGISFSGVTSSKIDKVWVENLKGDGISFVSFSNNNIISNNSILSNGVEAVNLDASSNNIISDNQIQSNLGGVGIYLRSSSDNNIISKNNVQLNGKGIFIMSSNNVVSNNNVELSTNDGITLYSSSNNVVSDNNIRSNGTYGLNVYGSGSNVVSNNNIHLNSKDGILVSQSFNNNFIGNQIFDNGGSNDYSGVSLDLSDSNLIASNRFSDTAPGAGGVINYGINLSDSGSENNYLSTNYIDGTGYIDTTYDRRINDGGTGTRYTGKEKITLERVAAQTVTNTVTTLNAATSPKSYLPVIGASAGASLKTSSPWAIESGKAVGDILILEGADNTNWVRVPNNSNTRLGAANRDLGQDDILKLIWNGTAWLELAFSDN